MSKFNLIRLSTRNQIKINNESCYCHFYNSLQKSNYLKNNPFVLMNVVVITGFHNFFFLYSCSKKKKKMIFVFRVLVDKNIILLKKMIELLNLLFQKFLELKKTRISKILVSKTLPKPDYILYKVRA